MTRSKLERNTNHDAVPAGHLKQQAVKSSKGGGGNKKGRFVGVPSGIHIHIVSDNTHLQVGTDRIDFDPAKQAEVNKAIAALKKPGVLKKPGADQCLEWLEQPANKRK